MNHNQGKSRPNRTGVASYTVTPWTIRGQDGWVLNYTHHGSSFVHAEEFTDHKALETRLEELRADIKAGLNS